MTSESSGQFLTFTLEEVRYAIPVAMVIEVLENSRITRLPRRAEWLKGLIDVRGQCIPVLDLKCRFGMGDTQAGTTTAVIVVELPSGGRAVKVGFLADAVHEVIDIPQGGIEAAPGFGAAGATDFLVGLGRVGEAFLPIIDLSRLFGEEEIAESRAALEEAAPA